MAQRLDQLKSTVERTFDGRVLRLERAFDQLTLEIAAVDLLAGARVHSGLFGMAGADAGR